MLWSYFAFLVLLLLMSLGILKSGISNHTGVRSAVWLGVFVLKILAGFTAIWIFTYHYSGASDLHLYFKDAQVLKDFFWEQPEYFWKLITQQTLTLEEDQLREAALSQWNGTTVNFLFNEKKIIVFVHLLITTVSFGNIYIHSLFMAFLSFWGQVAIFKVARRYLEVPNYWLIITIFLLPTSLFWTSSLFKEPFAVFSFGLSLYFLDKTLSAFSWRYLITFLLLVFVGLSIRPFVMISALFPMLIFSIYTSFPKIKFKYQSWLVVLGILILAMVLYGLEGTSFDVLQKISNKQQAFFELQNQDNNIGSLMPAERLEPHLSSLILNLPSALSRVLFHPSFLDYKKALYLPDIIENLLLLILVFIAFVKFRTPSRKTIPFLWFSILYILISYSVIGLICNILGAIVRYKIIAFPFSFLFVIAIINPRWAEHFNKKVEKIIAVKQRK